MFPIFVRTVKGIQVHIAADAVNTPVVIILPETPFGIDGVFRKGAYP